MSAALVVTVLAAAGAAALVPAVAPRVDRLPGVLSGEAESPQVWWLRRFRAVLALAAAAGGWVLVGGLAGLVAAPLAGWWCWRAIGRAESEAERALREAVGRDLPVLTTLVAIGLRAGIDPVASLRVATGALGGPAAVAVSRLVEGDHVGADPARAWERLATSPGLEPLGRCFARAAESGGSVVTAVERLGVELARSRRAVVEDRARQVGVKAAVPLGVCLLPAFLLVGIVPLVGGLISSLG